MSLRRLVTDPRGFYAERADDPSLRGPLVVVTLHAAVVLVVAVVALTVFTDLIREIASGRLVYEAGDQRVSAPSELVFSLVATAVLFYAVWLVASAVVYAVSAYFDGDGSFRRVLALVGWGLAPTLVPAVLANGVLVALLLGAPTFETEAAAEQWVRANVGGNVAFEAVQFARPVFTLWMAYLWVLAAEYGRDVPRRQAVVCVALPAALSVLNDLDAYYRLVANVLG